MPHSNNFFARIPEKYHKLTFLRSRTKYCPGCLKDGKYQRFLWGINFSTVCVKHGMYLLYECQGCGKKVTQKSLINGYCNSCGFELDNSTSETLPTNDYIYKSQQEIQKMILGQKSDLNQFSSLGEFIVGMKFAQNLLEGHRSFIKTNQELLTTQMHKGGYYDNFQFGLFLANVYWFYQELPMSFSETLDCLDEINSEQRKRKVSKLKKMLKESKELNFLSVFYDNYQDEEIRKGNLSRNVSTYDLKLFQKRVQNFYIKNDLISDFGLTKIEVKNLCKLEILKPRKIKRGNQENTYFNKEETIEAITNYKNKKGILITKGEAAKILGISMEGINSIISHGVLQEAALPINHCSLNKEDVFSLLDTLNVRMGSSETNSNVIPIAMCIEKYGTSGYSFGKLFSHVRSGSLDAFAHCPNPSISELHFDERQLRELYHKERIQNKGYTLKDVSQILKFGERTIHKMIEHNLIRPVEITITKNKRKTYYFGVSGVEDFKTKYILVEEASKEYGMRMGQIYKLIRRSKLKNYFEGVCRKVMVKREDLDFVLQQSQAGQVK